MISWSERRRVDVLGIDVVYAQRLDEPFPQQASIKLLVDEWRRRSTDTAAGDILPGTVEVSGVTVLCGGEDSDADKVDSLSVHLYSCRSMRAACDGCRGSDSASAVNDDSSATQQTTAWAERENLGRTRRTMLPR